MAFDSLSERLNKAFRNLSGKGTLSDNNMEEMLKEVRVALLEADVNYGIVKEFLDTIREKARGEEVLKSVEPGQQLVKIIHDEILALLGSEDALIQWKPNGITTIMMVGLQGTGKTTSIAKVANQVQLKQKRKALLIAADVIRPAAIDQLKTLGQEINAEVFSMGASVSALETVEKGMVYAKEKDYDTVFIDTAGRLHIDEALMKELQDISQLVKPDEILLTVDAMTGQDIVNVANAFKEALTLTGLVVTKFDGDSRGGGVLSVRKITGVPIKFVGEGEKVEDMDVFHPDRMADRILGMGDVVSLVEKAQEKLDMEENARLAEKMMNGQFTMGDMLKQFEQIQKMGPLGGIMKMIPGMNRYAGMLDEAKADKSMVHMKAIIQSMTPYERAFPDKMRGSMKKRIAQGSGRSVDEVNKLINQFNKMKKLMDAMSGLSRSGNLNEDSLEKMFDTRMGGMNNAMKKKKYKF
ncbi:MULTISPECIES: signal recognition particle protein [Terrabacteria group]|uniref:signal recognition particle protein n=1 Tax=Bacillati TaxID=1783272 RepID=UPI001C6ECE36|nr:MULTISPECIES: signal recognition particle protein [Terrabacteria group]MBW9212070.1 signal recognition particle protein [Trueperella sp. zg.1013]